MLTSTFCHIPGVGPTTECRLWDAGVTTWDAALAAPGAGRSFRSAWLPHVHESRRHYDGGNPAYFSERLPGHCHWRLYRDFRDACAFLDIETTGMGYGDAITTIALYDGRQVRHYVNGQNLEAFPDDVRDYRLLVTYNGRSFDVPFIERYFGVRLPHAHIDLRYVLARLGITGGLKRCEEQVGLARPGLEGVDGYAAVVLWHEYRDRHSERALETLLAYNVQDAVNLETLMVHAYNAHAARTPFADTHTLTARTPPALPFRPDPATVERVRRLCTRLPWAYAF